MIGRIARHVTPLLVLQVLLAAVLLNAGIGKYAGDPGPVETFDEVGLGQWFRYVTGTIEIAAGVGLLITPVAGLAALAAVPVLAGAVVTETVILSDGNALVPAIVLVLLMLVAWLHRARIEGMFRRVANRTRG